MLKSCQKLSKTLYQDFDSTHAFCDVNSNLFSVDGKRKKTEGKREREKNDMKEEWKIRVWDDDSKVSKDPKIRRIPILRP